MGLSGDINFPDILTAFLMPLKYGGAVVLAYHTRVVFLCSEVRILPPHYFYIGDYMELFAKYLQGLSVMLSIDIVSSCFLAVMVMAVIVAVFSLLRG